MVAAKVAAAAAESNDGDVPPGPPTDKSSV
jgi:hypothetical protein